MSQLFAIYSNNLGFVSSESFWSFTPNFNRAEKYMTYDDAEIVRQRLIDIGLKMKLTIVSADNLIIVAIPQK